MRKPAIRARPSRSTRVTWWAPARRPRACCATSRGAAARTAGGDLGAPAPPASGLLRDKPTLDALNAMGIDVGTLGNHEFDRGVPEMLRQINGGTSTVDPTITFDKLNFPVADANVISDTTGQPLLRPYTIKVIGGAP